MSQLSVPQGHRSGGSRTASPTGSFDSLQAPATDSNASARVSNKDEDELSEYELRRLFEDEEIERFLGLFADYVSEVTVPISLKEDRYKSVSSALPKTSQTSEPLEPHKDNREDKAQDGSDDSVEEWVPIGDSVNNIPSAPLSSKPTTLSEMIAFKYLLPLLPPAGPLPEQFTMGRLRLTVQRVYLTTQPVYGPFFNKLSALATWKNRSISLIYCLVYWILWYRGLLLPAFFTRILFSLLRRKVLPYPTLSQLRQHRAEIARAESFGEEVQTRLGASSELGWMEAWRLFRVFSKPKKEKVKQTQTRAKERAKGNGADQQKATGSDESPEDLSVDAATVLDDAKENEKEKDAKRSILIALTEIADVHERVKNIFLWRRPSSAWVYVCVISLLAVVTAFVSAEHIAKLVGFVGGIFFWHITPIISSLPPEDPRRLPPPFNDSPTDADYAMELISQRISRAEEIRPRPRKQKLDKGKQKRKIDDSDEKASETKEKLSPRHGEVDWKRWGQRAIQMRLLGEQSVKWMMKGQEEDSPRDMTDTDVGSDTFTYPAQYNASPGLLTITPRKLLFTPLTSPRPKLQISLDSMCRVKKAGAMRGLHIQWRDQDDSESEAEIHVEKFLWVGGRDEVFARLVGWGGKHWLKV